MALFVNMENGKWGKEKRRKRGGKEREKMRIEWVVSSM
jgi:hypothetical protein